MHERPTPARAVPTEALLLLWLSREGEGSPLDATQAGIALALGVSRSQASRLVGALLRRGWVEERTQRLAGFTRQVSSYALTASGREGAEGVRSSLEGRSVQVLRGGSAQSLPLGDALRLASPRLSLWDAVRHLDAQGRLDLDAASAGAEEPPRPGYQRELSEAPPARLFSGRARHQKEVEEWLRSPAPLLCVEAPAGEGKSALAAHVVRQAAIPRHVLWVRVTESLTAATFANRLHRFLVRLGRPGLAGAGSDADSLAAALREGFGRVPCLVVLDDVHKAAADLQPALHGLVRAASSGGNPKLWLLGRDVAVPHDAVPETRRLLLGPLQDTEAGEILGHLGVPAGERQRLVGICGGNPLFLCLAARGSPARGRTDVARYLLEELLPELPPADLRILHCLCTARTPLPATLLAHLGADDEAALQRLERRNLVVRDALGQADMHDVVRANLYDGLTVPDRQAWHGRLAEAHRPRGEEWSGVVEYLHHLGRAGRREEAIRWLLRNKNRFLEAMESALAPPDPVPAHG